MRLVALAILVTLTGIPSALAQNTVRYLTNVRGLMGDLLDSAIIKETRTGAKLVSAELDVCHTTAPDAQTYDRFVVTLKPQGNKLSGSGQTQESKTPVNVDLTRTVKDNNINFTGTIKLGNASLSAESEDNSDMSAKDFESENEAQEIIVEAPEDFKQETPGTVAMRVNRASLIDFLKAMRAEKIRVQSSSLAPDCDTLRRGNIAVQIDVDPERAAALVAKAKAMPGVTRSGWTNGGIGLDRALRMPAAPWRDADGKLDRDKLGKALADATSKALSGKSAKFEWDDVTGELSIEVKRPDTTVPGLDLTQTIEATFVVSGERPGAPNPLVVRIGTFSSEIDDDGEGPRLTLSAVSGEEGAAEPSGADGVQAALAKELKAERWDSEKEAWVK